MLTHEPANAIDQGASRCARSDFERLLEQQGRSRDEAGYADPPPGQAGPGGAGTRSNAEVTAPDLPVLAVTDGASVH